MHIVIILISAYILMLVIVYCMQKYMLYFPEKEIVMTPGDINLPYEEITFKTKDGIAIAAWFVPAENEKGVLLFCHGNAGNISHRLDSIKIFNSLSLSVLIFDYRGYGRSEGKPDEEGTYLDAQAAWDYLVQAKEKVPEKIMIFGRSLGGAVAAELALRANPAGLIVESSFSSIPDLGKKLYPWLPVKMLSKYHYATVDKVNLVKCPKLIIHSPQDEIIPYTHGQAIFKKAAFPKKFLEISGGHNEGFLVSGQVYQGGLKEFMDKCL